MMFKRSTFISKFNQRPVKSKTIKQHQLTYSDCGLYSTDTFQHKIFISVYQFNIYILSALGLTSLPAALFVGRGRTVCQHNGD